MSEGYGGSVEGERKTGGGTVVGDTHAASLTGSDTHAASLTGTDTHAASLTGVGDVVADTSQESGANGGTAAFAPAIASANISTTETTVGTPAAVTPSNAQNIIAEFCYIFVRKDTATGTLTQRFKEGATTLVSETTASLGIGSFNANALNGVLTDVSVVAHTYTHTIQFSTNGGVWAQQFTSITPLSLSDTHAASLTGSDTHAASLTGSDTHAASLTGSQGTCQ